MQEQIKELESEISDAEIEAEIFQTIKAYEDRPHLIKNGVRERMRGVPVEQVKRALDRLSKRSIVC